jgi:uncharacterized protein DUF3108
MAERRLGLLAASLLLSSVIHGLTLELPGWQVPDTAESEAEPLQATLIAPPRPALAAPPEPRPVVHPRPTQPPRRPKPPAVEPSAPTASLPAPVTAEPGPAEPTAESPAEPAPEASTAEAPSEPSPPAEPMAQRPPPAETPVPTGGPSWPRQGRIVYDVFRGDKDFLVGRTEHSWEQDGRRYRMQTVVETIGLAALMRSFHYVQRSEGRVTAWGLAPEQFRVEQAGKPDEGADFAWDAEGVGEAVVRRAKGRERRAEVRAGDQDVLSIWHQLALMGDPPPHRRLTLVSNKAATPAELETLGVDVLDLPLGHLMAHHLRARALDGSLSLDIWLAEKYGYLPVRILVRDRQGETFDQRAREVFRGDAGGAEAVAPEENKSNE